MASPEELTPELREVFDYLQKRPCQELSVRDVRIPLGLTNGAARYRLNRLWHLGYINRYTYWILRPRIRRIRYHYIPPPKLYKIKIRLYTEERKPTPTGMFQAWWDIIVKIDAETGLVDWSWWLVEEQIRICRYHTIGYFKGLRNWRSEEDIGLAYFFEKDLKEKGIPTPGKRATYKEPHERYAPGIPAEYIAKAERLTVKDLILGESSVEPKPVINIDKEIGVYFQKVMIIDEGTIKWQERRDRFIPLKEYAERVKKELGIG